MLDAHRVEFEIGAFDPTRELVIDPVISYSTYLGGTGLGAVTGVAADGTGNLYAVGWTEALNFPIAGAYQAANNGDVDAFVVKMNPAGTTLLYATYIGGSGDERAAAIAIDSFGQAYVTGATESTNFPVVAAAQATLKGGKDAFALKLSAVGNTLLYSTYLGGTNSNSGTAIAVDSSENVYVAGDTLSANFPVTSGAAQTTFGGATDAFIAKLTSAGAITYSTFLGGSAAEHAGGIAVDASGSVYVAGGTMSTNLPLVGAIQSKIGGLQNVFVAKLNAAGSQLIYSTYLGGNGATASALEQANGIAVDASGDAYVAGVTSSTNFPVTLGAFQTGFDGGTSDAFIAKLNPAGSALVYSTYLGGSSFDWASGVAVDAGGNASVAGYTSSFDFPVISPLQLVFNGLYDAFIAKINATGNGLAFSTWLGGTGADLASSIALDSSGDIYTGGETSSTNFPSQGALQSTNLGGAVGWLARINLSATPSQVPSAVSVSPSSGSGSTVNFVATYSTILARGGASALTSVALLVNSDATTNFGCYVTYTPSSNALILFNDAAGSGGTTGRRREAPRPIERSVHADRRGEGSVGLSGNTLTLTLSLAFIPRDSAATRPCTLWHPTRTATPVGWRRGTWNVILLRARAPWSIRFHPTAALGSTQIFTFVFSDTQNVANMTGLGMLFSSSPTTFTNACYLLYDGTKGVLGLYYDNLSGQSDRAIGSQTVLSNSQCSIGNSTYTISGLTFTITLAVTFKSGFNGPTNIYMYASDYVYGNNTGWVQEGTFQVTVAANPAVNSVVPSSGTGAAQRFTFTASEPGGGSLINYVGVLFAPTFNMVNACYLQFDGTKNTISLAYQNPAGGATPVTPGSTQIATNNQCNLYAQNSTITYGVTTITVTLDLAFDGSFAGTQNIYVIANSTGYSSGWTTVGTWTVVGGSPTATAVTPSSGAGSTVQFVFSGADSVTQTNITGMNFLFTMGAPSNTANACYLVYSRATGTIVEMGCTTTLERPWWAPKEIGYSTTLANSQCAVGYTDMLVTGLDTITFTLQLFFTTPAFDGIQDIYFQTNEATGNSGLVFAGTWTVQ